MQGKNLNWQRFTVDISIISILAILAGCGIIYEYLLSHYAGRVLGLMEHAIFTMIGVMIVSMGVGALAAQKIKDANSGFVIIELSIAFIGSLSVVLIAWVMALTNEFPKVLGENYGLPADLIPRGGGLLTLTQFSEVFPFIIGFILGCLVGMEIPLIARVREEIYNARLKHNTGTVYGADYLGAGVGAAIFIIFLLSISPARAAIWVSSVNLIVGFLFLIIRWKKIRYNGILAGLHMTFACFLIYLSTNIEHIQQGLENTLYTDEVIFSQNTNFQYIVLTQRNTGADKPIYTLYLNGRSQFCSCDEALYHSMLVNPPLLASARQDHILLIGGGDGLAVRDILKWNPQSIDVLELDRGMIDLFSKEQKIDGEVVNQPLLDLNQYSFSDKRVNVIYGDAFNSVDDLIQQRKKYDAIIIDLPDPSHPDLNKLYSTIFYKKVRELLSGDGALSIQSTSPYHARDAFLTVGVTLRAAGFKFVERYHANIPTFGEWGWTIATTVGQSPSKRILRDSQKIPENMVSNIGFIMSSFDFPNGILENEKFIKPNDKDSNLMYILHEKSWLREEINVGNKN